jgi:hypothetical protein
VHVLSAFLCVLLALFLGGGSFMGNAGLHTVHLLALYGPWMQMVTGSHPV